MEYKAAVITMSDKGAQGLREDTAGDAVAAILEENGWHISYRTLIPDEMEQIKSELIKCADELAITLVVTTGGTGFSLRDVTPEATLAVIDREVRGIPEAMRAESMKITPMGMLSRAAAGLRKQTLIINLPGSRKAAGECLEAVIKPIRHGVEVLVGEASDCAAMHLKNTPAGNVKGVMQAENTDHAVAVADAADGSGQKGEGIMKAEHIVAGEGIVKAVCISEKKGEQKHEIAEGFLKTDHGIEGDAHAGNWHRQVSLLAAESVAKVQKSLDFPLKNGDFAENILTEGIVLHQLPVGTKMQIGAAEGEVTQIGKECHHGCAIRELAGDCVMPREGIFIKILKSGKVKAGDTIKIYRN